MQHYKIIYQHKNYDFNQVDFRQFVKVLNLSGVELLTLLEKKPLLRDSGVQIQMVDEFPKPKLKIKPFKLFPLIY